MSYADKVELLVPYLLSITLFIVGMNLLIYTLYWRSKPSKITRNFGVYWLVQLVGLLLTPVFSEGNLAMSIPYSFTMLNLCIIYNTFFIDRKSATIALSVTSIEKLVP